MMYQGVDVFGIKAAASNIRSGEKNPEYTAGTFLTMYPQFKDLVPAGTLDMYIELAQAQVTIGRFRNAWKMAMGLLIAHYCTLFLQTAAQSGDAVSVASAGSAVGTITSESADGVSYSRDTSSVTSDMAGWGAFKLTAFGVQFVTLAKAHALGGMMVW